MDWKSIKEAAKKGKEGLYKAIAGAEQNTSYEGAKKLVGAAIDKGRVLREDIRERGGLANIAQETIDNASSSLMGFLENLDSRYSDFEKDFFPDGKLDKERVRKALTNTAETGKKYGKETVKMLISIRDAAVEDYRNIAPSKEERDTIYAGIHSPDFSVMTRARYENCLALHDSVRSQIPGRPKYKTRILVDIKSNAIEDKDSLLDFYKEDYKMTEIISGLELK